MLFLKLEKRQGAPVLPDEDGTTGCIVKADFKSAETCTPGTTARRPVLPGKRDSAFIFQVMRCEGLFPTRTIFSQNCRPCPPPPALRIVAAGIGLPRPDLLRGSLPLLDLLHGLRYLALFPRSFGLNLEP